jgi:prepilin-type N-terminal cleavage/methylation domain-containing protein
VSKKTKGFTIVEIVVVLTILSVLAGAGIPTMLKYIDNAKEKLCLSNKLTMVRLFKSYSMLYPDHDSLQEVLDCENEFLKKDFESLKCPSGGQLSAVDVHVICSIHDVDTDTNPEDPTEENPSDLTHWTIFENLVVGSADKIFNAAADSNGGIKYKSGLIFGKGNEIYIFGHNSQLNKEDATKYIDHLSDFESIIKINTTNRRFKPNDYNKSSSGNWNDDTVKNGDFFTDEMGQTWIFTNRDSDKALKPTGSGTYSGGWLKLVSGKAYIN